jgi:hypothetical protein
VRYLDEKPVWVGERLASVRREVLIGGVAHRWRPRHRCLRSQSELLRPRKGYRSIGLQSHKSARADIGAGKRENNRLASKQPNRPHLSVSRCRAAIATSPGPTTQMRAPERVLKAHSSDQVAHLLGDPRSTPG